MWVLQSPSEKLDWHENWSDFIGAGDGIASSSWEIVPAGPTLSGATFDGTSFFTTVLVDDLELGQTYQLRNTIETNFGVIAAREIIIRCDHRQL